MSYMKFYGFDDDGEPRTMEETVAAARADRAQQDSEDGRCSNCGRRVATRSPYALCRRCGDEMNTGGRW